MFIQVHQSALYNGGPKKDESGMAETPQELAGLNKFDDLTLVLGAAAAAVFGYWQNSVAAGLFMLLFLVFLRFELSFIASMLLVLVKMLKNKS
jgi:hypothetical protein